MVYKILNLTLSMIIKRGFFILTNLLLIIFSVYCLNFLFGFLQSHSNLNAELNSRMCDILNGVAGVLVALGVLMESREVIFDKLLKKPIDEKEKHLNEIAEQNGLGLLLIGLFMEIFTLMIEVPNELINTDGVEIYLFYSCFFLIITSIVVEIDLIKDYVKSYFKKH